MDLLTLTRHLDLYPSDKHDAMRNHETCWMSLLPMSCWLLCDTSSVLSVCHWQHGFSVSYRSGSADGLYDHAAERRASFVFFFPGGSGSLWIDDAPGLGRSHGCAI